MISLDEALQRIDEAVAPLTPKKVPLFESVGCRLAEEITAGCDVPSFSSSAMDGIAIAFSDLSARKLPMKFRVQGTIPAGKISAEPLKSGHAFRIMTGAPLPSGADTVIKVEDLQFEEDQVIVSEMPERNSHVRPIGNDIRAGEIVLPIGVIITPVDAGICASLGLTEISVHSRPTIAVFATGSEIRSPGESLQAGQIYNSNDTTIMALLRRDGFSNVTNEPPISDSTEVLIPTLCRLCSEKEVVVTSGAVSAGSFDFIPAVVRQLQGEILFHKVAIKPGKPTLIAKIGGCWLLALPGNPVSVVVTYHLYVRRVLSLLMAQELISRREKARLKNALTVSGNRFQIVGAHLTRENGEILAEPVTRYSSGRLSSIRGINGFISVSGGTRELAAGLAVDVEWL